MSTLLEKRIYFKLGKQSLPGELNAAHLVQGSQVTAVNIADHQSLGLVKKAAFLEDTNLKHLDVGRIVRKTSERQSRWVIDAALTTWKQQNQNADSTANDEKDTGLFLGLGTVDCEDNDLPIPFDGTSHDYAQQMLIEAKPLAGLILLNSTTASHIAQLTNITGVNCVFSPFADAGAQAIIEAFFNIREGKCRQALVAAGSPKITPWYFLHHRDFFQQWNNYNIFPSESAAALVASDKPGDADACLITVIRTFSGSTKTDFPMMSNLLEGLSAKNIVLPQQIIYTGGFDIGEERKQNLTHYFPDNNLHYIDQLTGYTGAAGALHAVFFAATLLQEKRKDITSSTALIIAEGFNGQICYMVIGEADE
ncbi:MAG: hypothetical protein ACJAUP_001671 [Cellvibrionaceae bacterium]|jgi:hypothetical protein